jgi:hypothetical protein
VPEQWRGNEAKRNDLAVVESEGPQGSEAHTPVMCNKNPRFSEERIAAIRGGAKNIYFWKVVDKDHIV